MPSSFVTRTRRVRSPIPPWAPGRSSPPRRGSRDPIRGSVPPARRHGLPAPGCDGTADRAGAVGAVGPTPADGTPRSPTARRTRTAPPNAGPQDRGRRSGRALAVGVGPRALRGPGTYSETTGVSSRAGGARAEGYGRRLALVTAHPRDLHFVARLVLADGRAEIVARRDVVAAELDDRVARLKAGVVGAR